MRASVITFVTLAMGLTLAQSASARMEPRRIARREIDVVTEWVTVTVYETVKPKPTPHHHKHRPHHHHSVAHPSPSSKAAQPVTSQAPKPTSEAPKPTTEAPKPTTEAPKPTTEAPKPTPTPAPETTKEAPKPTTTTPPPANTPPPSHQNTGSLTEAEQQALDTQNKARAAHHVDPLTWSTDLANKARSWGEKCVFQHSGGSLGPFGENLAAGSGAYTAASGVQAWLDEEKDYTYGSDALNHFTQVVWKGSKETGCALVTCGPGTIFSDPKFGNAQFLVCEYSPAGNFIGQGPQNVLRP